MRELTGEKHGLICLYTRVRVRGGGGCKFSEGAAKGALQCFM